MKKKYKPGKYKPPKKEPLFTFKDFLNGLWDFVKTFLLIPFILLVLFGFAFAYWGRYFEVFYGG